VELANHRKARYERYNKTGGDKPSRGVILSMENC